MIIILRISQALKIIYRLTNYAGNKEHVKFTCMQKVQVCILSSLVGEDCK